MKNLKRVIGLAAGIIIGAKYIINCRQVQKKEKEHQLILKLLIESDGRIKKLIKNENIEAKGIKFKKHSESEKFCDTPQRIIWRWDTTVNRKVWIPLDKDNSIIPYNKDIRLFNLAHEFSHIEIGFFSKSYKCGFSVDDCLCLELQAHAGAIERLEKINAQFDRLFWQKKLASKRWQCEDCLKIIKKRKCPEDKVSKIKNYLNAINQISGLESEKIIFKGKRNG